MEKTKELTPKQFYERLGQYDRPAKYKVGTNYMDNAGNKYKYIGIKFGHKWPLVFTWLPEIIKFDLNIAPNSKLNMSSVDEVKK